MSDPTYTIKEILDIKFDNLSRELGGIKETLKEQNTSTEAQFRRLDTEVESIKKEVGTLREENARYKTIWGIGATVGASLIAILTNRIF